MVFAIVHGLVASFALLTMHETRENHMLNHKRGIASFRKSNPFDMRE